MKLVDELIGRVEAATGRRFPEPMRHPLNVAWTLFQDYIRCDLLKQASAMAYVMLLSMIPSLVAIFVVLSLFSPLVGKDSNLIEKLKDFILENLATGSGESAVAYLDQMISSLNLATMGISSFAMMLVSLILLLRQIEEALNRIWLIRKPRNMFTRFMYFWTFLTLGVLVLAIGVGVTGGFNLDRYVSPETVDAAVPGWLVGIVGTFLFFFFLYKIVPNCRVHAKNAAIGAIIAAVLLQQGVRFYTYYVAHTTSFTIYGTLSQVPIFLTFLYLVWTIILLGALISWRMQEGFPKSEKDDTLDAVKSPVESLRNVQVKGLMPVLTLVTIYKNFQRGTGRGVSGQDLAHALKLPIDWISDALDVLVEMGYVIASKNVADEDVGTSVLDPYFPAYPAEVLSLWRLQADLARPVDEWLRDWQHELPLDLAKTLAVFDSSDLKSKPDATFADALALVPSRT